MITDKQRRNQIIRRIQKISPDKIKKLQAEMRQLSMKMLQAMGGFGKMMKNLSKMKDLKGKKMPKGSKEALEKANKKMKDIKKKAEEAKKAVEKWLRKIVPYINTAAALFILLTGLYLIYYWTIGPGSL